MKASITRLKDLAIYRRNKAVECLIYAESLIRNSDITVAKAVLREAINHINQAVKRLELSQQKGRL